MDTQPIIQKPRSNAFNFLHFYSKQLASTVFILLILSFFLPDRAFATLSFEVATGDAYNFPIPLHISQSGYPDINMTAHYETRPFSPPPYYLLRIGKWTDNKAWELEFIHHKLYLNNTTDEVTKFTITNGYNLVTINRAWLDKRNLIWRLGAGIVLAHPESTIRGQKYSETGGVWNDDGYYIAGPTAMASLGKRFYLTRRFFIELEGKLTASYTNVKIASGNADAPDVALHANLGIGYDI